MPEPFKFPNMPFSDRAQAVLDFWFGAPGTPEYGTARGMWFKKDAAIDEAIRQNHFEDYEASRDGDFDAWMKSAYTSLALVILLDQFPRNLFRNDPRAFATDAKALNVAQKAIAGGFDQAVPLHHRVFFYLPFEHSEDLAMQKRSVELVKRMPEFTTKAQYYDFAVRHLEIVERFGRFPHRNAVLGRANTPEEAEFLKQPHSAF